jgi:hypothetical protein
VNPRAHGGGNRGLTAAGLVSVLVVAVTGPLGAQVRPAQPPPPASLEQIQARHDIASLEGVLENAVGYGAQMLSQYVQSSATPESILLTGQARARGFRLDGYGVVFDVEFPSIRRSVAWTMKTLERPDPDLLSAMKELRKNTQDVADQRSQQELDRAIRSLEDQIKAYNARTKNVSRASNTMAAVGSAGAAVAVDDPRVFYAAEMANALINAVLDHGTAAGVGANEWLTVAARESLDFRFMPDDPATTLILRVKGSDLAALGEKRLSREEARQRIEVKQY